ncbi:dihydropteroate synthase [Actibacterium pelagium]|uniref:Dihydropteroate synthase n=1 Tax=Actibacterium pelagium TaxID=2029103 RepID=A0A917EIA9_9RHOB|nr:dihydropteroate synthase [Actibacterium pelagium]GGE47735.1 dihydropteroate synthase [Actibacterium pelagium]
MSVYYRPLVQSDPFRPDNALPLAGGRSWFTHVEILERGRPSERIEAVELPDDAHAALTEPREPIAGLSMDRARIMAVMNVTPDSFSDGGMLSAPGAAKDRANQLIEAGADILDIGGESTRPGADTVPVPLEITRVVPLITTLRLTGVTVPISVDTRKSLVAQPALAAGANIINDVAGLTYDPLLAGVVALNNAPVCLMHAQGDPKTMQDAPSYDNVLLDVYDFLADRIQAAETAGIPRSRIMIDPGIGFGKTLKHNLTLLQGISLFHGLGCPILLGVSRKRMIGEIGKEPDALKRAPGSIAIALEAARQGVQILRVHDVKETRQALSLSEAVWG